MSGPRSEPCNWGLLSCLDSQEGECPTLANMNPGIRSAVERAAISFLWNWSGRQFGTCPVVVRPCKDSCPQYYTTYRGWGGLNNNLPYYTGYPGPLNPALIAGEWFNLGCGGCGSDPCSCSYVPTVTLKGPVAAVTEVLIDGTVLPTDAYRVDNYQYLVRTDGGDWPACQNQTADPSEDNTFQVTYEQGVEVPSGGQLAAGILACEYGKLVCGDNSCRLPTNTSGVNRQGVSITFESVYQNMYALGTTGLFFVDQWLGSIRAADQRASLRVASPDLRAPRRTTSGG